MDTRPLAGTGAGLNRWIARTISIPVTATMAAVGSGVVTRALVGLMPADHATGGQRREAPPTTAPFMHSAAFADVLDETATAAINSAVRLETAPMGYLHLDHS